MFGEKIRYVRKMRGFTVSEVAKRAGINQGYLSNIERNTRTNPSRVVLDGIANALDIPVDILLNDDISVEELGGALAYKRYNKLWDDNISISSCNMDKMKPTPIFSYNNTKNGFLQEIVGFDCLPVSMTADNNLFEIEMPDNSLLGLGVRAGDYIIAKYQIDAVNGDIVVISLDSNIVVRRINKVDSCIVLSTANKDYAPMIIRSFDDINIIGKVIGVKVFFPTES